MHRASDKEIHSSRKKNVANESTSLALYLLTKEIGSQRETYKENFKLKAFEEIKAQHLGSGLVIGDRGLYHP